MITLVVVENPKRWPFEIPDVEVVPARAYLTDPRYAQLKRAAVFNVCRHYGYQTTGYYVSLLAAARGHRHLPSVDTLQSVTLDAVVRAAADELDELVNSSLRSLRSDTFELSVYFGRNTARKYDRLAGALFNLFPAPFLRARFTWSDDAWRLSQVRPIPTGEIPEHHRQFVLERAAEYFERPRRVPRRSREARYDLAILWSADDQRRPSNERGIKRFVKAAARTGIEARIIGPEDYARLAEFDALFIRTTTSVDHYTYRFARRAAAQGMVVVDDPESIIRCTNKVFQAEAFARNGIPAPATMVVHEGNVDDVGPTVGFPCVLKQPDGAFSAGVVRVADHGELLSELVGLFEESELVVAQAFTPSDFDWRVGVLGGRPLFAARYHMAKGHWQIVDDQDGSTRYGRVEAVPVEEAPPHVLDVAVRAAALMGEGLYGVDLKEIAGRVTVMEVNDNPNLDGGQEDAVLKDELWDTLARWFRERLDRRGSGST